MARVGSIVAEAAAFAALGLDEAAATVRCTLHVRLATPARLKRAAKDIRSLPFVSSVERRI